MKTRIWSEDDEGPCGEGDGTLLIKYEDNALN